MTFKTISKEAIPKAVEMAERYRLLNQPGQAESICDDILAADPDNHHALRSKFLAVTEQFDSQVRTIEDSERLANKFVTDYERYYYLGVAAERWALSELAREAHGRLICDWLRRAMVYYERAEDIRPSGNDDALLRWNACARVFSTSPELQRYEQEMAESNN